jgi:GAF domain-containing protein
MDHLNSTPLADVITEAARTINAPRSVDERVHAVVSAAPTTVPGFDEASISVAYRDGPVETRAASSDFVRELDHVQYDTKEGPCFEALRHPEVVLAPSLRREERWPLYVARATAAGIRAQMAVPLHNGGDVRGSLNLYRTTGEGIDPEATDIATLFATHAALALGWARTEEQLNDALATRKMIGEAIGVVMERYQINEDRAFLFLLRVSSTSNIKLRKVAQEVVEQTDTRYSFKDDE